MSTRIDNPRFAAVVKQLSTLLPSHNYAFVGGAVRDYIFGREPRDHDVVVLNLTPEDILERLQFSGLQFQRFYSYEGDRPDLCGERRIAFDSVWECCIKLSLPNGEYVDLLFPQRAGASVADVVELFDSNLNMYSAYPDGSVQEHWDTDPRERLELATNTRADRAQYMLFKWLVYLNIQ